MLKTCLAMIALSVCNPVFPQNTLERKYNSLRPDSINKEIIPYFDAGCEGENVTWDFSADNETPCDTTLFAIYYTGNKILWDYNGSLDTYFQRNDSLLLCRKESPLYEMDYHEPVVCMTYPFNYGCSISNRFSGTGSYEGKLSLSEQGMANVVADAYGRIILAEGDTINNVTRVRTTLTADVTVSDKTGENTICRVKKDTETFRWYARGYRYPVIENFSEKVFHEGRLIAQSQHAGRIPIDELKSLVDEENEDIRRQDSLAYVQAHPLESLGVTNRGYEAEVGYTLLTDAHVSMTLANSSGMVFWRFDEDEYAGESYSHRIPLSGLLRGQYVVYINANGEVENAKINIE